MTDQLSGTSDGVESAVPARRGELGGNSGFPPPAHQQRAWSIIRIAVSRISCNALSPARCASVFLSVRGAPWPFVLRMARVRASHSGHCGAHLSGSRRG